MRFGRLCLDPRNRVLLRDEAIVPLSPKTFDLLLYLVSNRGRVNTRAELMEALWPGIFVEEGSLAFQISSLRKALGEEGSSWIETVPKFGYRFTAPVDADQPAPPRAAAEKLEAEPGSAPVFRPSFLQIAGLTACLALVLVGGFSARWPSTGITRAGNNLAPVIPVTTFPGYESDPTLSPDGSQVAFSWTGPDGDNRDIYVKLIGTGEPIRITSGPEDDVSPQWSPDGRYIAYVSIMASKSSIMMIPALGGAPRRLTDGPIHGFRYGAAPVHFLAWTPDSRRLIIPSAAAVQGAPSQSGLVLIEIDSPDKVTRLTLPSSPYSGDWAPALSADGRRLAFIRMESIRAHTIMVQILDSGYAPMGSPVTLLRRDAPIGGLAWTFDDHALVYSAGGDIGVRYLELLPITGTTAKLPVMLGEGEQATTTATRGDRLVYTKVAHDSNIWSYPIDPTSVRLLGPPKQLAASSREDYQGELSPDGRTLAFVSSRSGFSEIWIANADGSFPRQMTRTQGPKTAGPHWSPDGRKILYDSQTAGQRFLYVLDPLTGETKRLPQGTDSFRGTGRWSPDGHWIYFTCLDQSGINIWRTSAQGGPAIRLTSLGGGTPVVSPDGQWIYYAKSESTPAAIWKVRSDASGGEQPVFTGVSYGDNFAVTERGMYFVGVEPRQQGTRGPRLTSIGGGQATLEYFDFTSRKHTLLHNIGKTFWYGCTLTPDGRHLLVAHVDEEGSDLMLIEHLRR